MAAILSRPQCVNDALQARTTVCGSQSTARGRNITGMVLAVPASYGKYVLWDLMKYIYHGLWWTCSIVKNILFQMNQMKIKLRYITNKHCIFKCVFACKQRVSVTKVLAVMNLSKAGTNLSEAGMNLLWNQGNEWATKLSEIAGRVPPGDLTYRVAHNTWYRHS